MRNRDLRPTAKANPTIQQAFEKFQKYNRLKNLSQGSLDFYAAKGRSFFRFLGDTEQPIHTITEETVEDYIFYMKDQQLHDTTINTNLRMVRAFLYWCMEKGYLEQFSIRLVRADDPIKEPYTTDELQKLLKEPDCKTCSFAEYRNWVIVNFLLGTGCRASTLLNLQIGDLDLSAGTVFFRHMKARNQQIVPLSKALVKIMEDYLEHRSGDPTAPLFVSEYGNKMTLNSLGNAVWNYNHSRGVEKTSMHLFRHTYAKLYIQAGGDPFRLQKLLGHADLTMTRRYVALYADDLRANYDALAKLCATRSRDVNRLGSIEVPYEDYDPALGENVNKTATENKYEHTIRVETYQWLETFLQRNEDAAKTYLRSFDYIVSDEYHYMVTDASFNDHVDASYEAIKELWTTKTCIFMSATARPFFDYWELRKMIPEGQHYRLPMDYRFVSSVKFFYCDDDELDIIRRVQPGEKILVFVNTIAKLRKLRDTLKADGIEDVVCLCSKYRQEAEEFDKLDDVLKGNVLQHQVTLTTTTLYNGVDMKDRALKYIVSELWNPLVNAQILGRKRPLDEGDTCAVYLLHYPKERLEGEVKKIEKYQLEPVEAYKEWFDDKKAWKAYLHQPETVEILKKSHTVVLDPREGEYCWRKRANLQARVERVFLLQMLEQGYQTELLKKIDESLLAKVERLEPPLLEYLDDHLNEERYYQDWQKIFFEMGHIYNKADGHAEKSLPSYTFARQWLQHYGYDLGSKQKRFEAGQKKMVWWVTKLEN